jgi:hypothetical protein
VLEAVGTRGAWVGVELRHRAVRFFFTERETDPEI